VKVDFKKLFLRLWRLLVSPRQEWEAIREESPRPDMLMTFFFPLTCCCGLAVLLGRLLREGFGSAFMSGFAEAVVACLGLVVAFYLSMAVVGWAAPRYLHMETDRRDTTLLVGYSFAVVFALTLLVGLFPAWVMFKWVLQFYVVYVVWVGADVMLQIGEDRRMTFSLMVSAVILLVPFLIQTIFNKLSLAFG